MKPEIKQLIIKELSDLMGRKVSKRTDQQILSSDKQRTPFDKVKEYYDKYLELGSMDKTAKFFGIATGNLPTLFNGYNLPTKTLEEYNQTARLNNLKKREKEIRDAYNLDFETWNKKYNKDKSMYYKRRETFLELNPEIKQQEGQKELEKLKDSLVLSFSAWNKKYKIKSTSAYYKAKTRYLKLLEKQTVNNL